MVSSTDTQVSDRAAIGDEIRARRRASGLGQVDLALAAGVGLTMLRDLEQGWSPTSRSHTVQRITATLDLIEEADRG